MIWISSHVTACVRVCVPNSISHKGASERPPLTLDNPRLSNCKSPPVDARFFSPQTPVTPPPPSFFSLFNPRRRLEGGSRLRFASTHRPGGQHGRVVVDVLDGDDGGGRVGEAEVQVALHVRRLHDDGVLRHFL